MIEKGFAVAGHPLDEAEAPRLLARFIEIYRARIAEESFAFEGLEPALDLLAAEGAILCVCTNKPTDLSNLLLAALGLSARFASVVGADAAPKPKPDASHLIAAVERAGGDPRRAIMVGDSETDVAAARAAGAPVIVVPFGYTEIPPEKLGGDILIRHFSALPSAVKRLLPTLHGAALNGGVSLRYRLALPVTRHPGAGSGRVAQRESTPFTRVGS